MSANIDSTEPQLLTAKKAREKNELRIQISHDEYVLARKEDMTVLVFEGRVPMPVLNAVQKMIDMPEATDEQRIAALGAAHGQELVDVLRQHAVRVVVKPKLVMEEDDNPDHVPVTYFDIPQLMAIWTETAIVPKIGAAAAARFRLVPSPNDAPAVPDGETVQPAAEPVADARPVDVISG